MTIASPSVDELRRMYCDETRSTTEISKHYGVSIPVIRRWLNDAGIPLRSRREGVIAAIQKIIESRRGQKRNYSPEWKSKITAAAIKNGEEHAAGISYRKGRYAVYTRGPNKGCSVHVVLMEQHIGRRLIKDEVVHHKDEDKHNNHIDNLELMTHGQHSRHHRNLHKAKKP